MIHGKPFQGRWVPAINALPVLGTMQIDECFFGFWLAPNTIPFSLLLIFSNSFEVSAARRQRTFGAWLEHFPEGRVARSPIERSDAVIINPSRLEPENLPNLFPFVDIY